MKYADISRTHRALKKLEEDKRTGDHNETYWAAHDEFKILLQHALHDAELMQKLTKPQFLRVLAWCTTFRPHEPHTLLTIFSNLAN